MFVVAMTHIYLVYTQSDPQLLKLKPNTVNLKLGRLPSYEYSKARTHMARVSFDLDADLTSLFNWNTKMLFVSVLVEWENKEYKQNQAVIWDDVIMRKEDALLQYKKKRSEYIVYDMIDALGHIS